MSKLLLYSVLIKKKIMQIYIRFYIIKYHIKNRLMVPKITKVVINVRFNISYCNNNVMINNARNILCRIFLQFPILVYSKQTITNFKLLKNIPISFKITLRNYFIYEFLGKLINIWLPSDYNFSGFNNKSFDYYGNYNFSINNFNIIFEKYCDKLLLLFNGFDVSICFTNGLVFRSYKFLKFIGFPFVK